MYPSRTVSSSVLPALTQTPTVTCKLMCEFTIGSWYLQLIILLLFLGVCKFSVFCIQLYHMERLITMLHIRTIVLATEIAYFELLKTYSRHWKLIFYIGDMYYVFGLFWPLYILLKVKELLLRNVHRTMAIINSLLMSRFLWAHLMYVTSSEVQQQGSMIKLLK